MKAKNIVQTLLFGLFTSTNPCADSGRSDYDIDNDRLIEINDINDLNEIRNNPNKIELYGTDRGCPSSGCIGYELITDLDFDTNSDKQINSQDQFWNAGAGWLPFDFTGIFEGNNHQILNIMINRPDEDEVGLFKNLNNSTVRNLRINGSLTSIQGKIYVGGLSAIASSNTTIDNLYFSGTVNAFAAAGGLVGNSRENSTITNSYSSGSITGGIAVGGVIGINSSSTLNQTYSTANVSGTRVIGGLIGVDTSGTISTCFATGRVSGGTRLGGIIGQSEESDISACFATGRIDGASYTGGLIGWNKNTYITSTYALGRVDGNFYKGGLFGSSEGDFSTSNYWATNTSAQQYDNGYTQEATAEGGFSLPTLRCPTKATNTSCVTDRLYNGWEIYVDKNGIPLWEFGNNYQTPGLRINNKVYRDNNIDGTPEISTAPNRNADPELISTHNYTKRSSYCGWSTPSNTRDENVSESTLFCNMGSRRVATKRLHSDGSCEINMNHYAYDLFMLNINSCHFGIYLPASNSSTPPSTTTFAYKAPGASGYTLATGCEWRLNYRDYGSTSYNLFCSNIDFAELLIYDASSMAGSPYSCEVRIHRYGLTGGGNYGYGQNGNIEACNPRISGTR